MAEGKPFPGRHFMLNTPPNQRMAHVQYISTRGGAPVLNFTDALLAGLARDGGL